MDALSAMAREVEKSRAVADAATAEYLAVAEENELLRRGMAALLARWLLTVGGIK